MSLIKHVLKPTVNSINYAVQNAIKKVENKQKAKGKSLEEPAYAAALAIEFPNLMNASNRFPNISFGGCFIHKKPKVEIISNKRAGNQKKSNICELGDVLVLLRKQTMDDTRYNAALIQLKKGKRSPVKLSKKDIQLYLYEKWPLFRLSSTQKQYDINPKTTSQGGMYGIIQEQPKTQIYISEPMSRMAFPNEMSVARFIYDAINFQTGRTISDKDNKDSDEWSKLIWDLLIHAIADCFTLNSVGYCKSPQCSGNFADFVKDELGTGIPTEGNHDDVDVNDNEESFAILIIDVDGREEEK